MQQKISHDSETPVPGQQVIVACAFIHHNSVGVEKVFLPKRAKTKRFLPDVYELPGGHIDFGEDIVEGLKREIFEEFGMNIKVGDPFYTFTYMNDIKRAQALEVIYFATFTDAISKISIHPEDHSAYGWFGEDEIETKVANSKKKIDDVETQAILRGFALLRGEPHNFGLL